LVSLTDTSWKSADFTGHSDKMPVLSQNLPEQERSPLCAVLSRPRVHLGTTHLEPDNNSGGRVATVSLRRGLPCQWLYHFSTECLLTSAYILAQTYKCDPFTRNREERGMGGRARKP